MDNNLVQRCDQALIYSEKQHVIIWEQSNNKNPSIQVIFRAHSLPDRVDISERSHHCLFRVGITLCSCRRSLHYAGPRPEEPHLEVLLWGQRSMLLNLSDNIYTETANTECNERNVGFTGTKENGAFNCHINLFQFVGFFNITQLYQKIIDIGGVCFISFNSLNLKSCRVQICILPGIKGW